MESNNPVKNLFDKVVSAVTPDDSSKSESTPPSGGASGY